MKLVVGLGNPGPRYAGSRHNVGFRIVDELARIQGVELLEVRFRGLFGSGFVPVPAERSGGAAWGTAKEAEPLGFLKPETFVNRSGESLCEALDALLEVVPERDLLVVYDDLDLPLGRIRLRPEGGAGGHNGMASIIESLGTQAFARLRFGIGRPETGGAVVDFVLDAFAPEEEGILAERIPTAAQAAATLLLEGPEVAMARFNADPTALEVTSE